MKTIKEYIHQKFTCVAPECTVRAAAEEMIRTGVETLFITRNDEVVGVIGIRDLFTIPIPASYGGPMKADEEETLLRAWENTPVEHLMNPHIISVPENYPLMDAAKVMINEGKHPLAILQGKQLIGILDRRDIVRALLTMVD